MKKGLSLGEKLFFRWHLRNDLIWKHIPTWLNIGEIKELSLYLEDADVVKVPDDGEAKDDDEDSVSCLEKFQPFNKS